MKKINKNCLISLVELPPTQFGLLNGALGYDVFSRTRLPSRALPTLHSILSGEGWNNVKQVNPLYNGDKGKLTSKNLKRIFDSDILGISSITRTSPQSMKLIEMYKSVNPKGIVIAGGPDPTFRTEDWLCYADIIVRREGEKTFPDLMNQLIEDPQNLEDIKGIAFRKNGETKLTIPRELLTPNELNEIPPPYYDRDTKKGVSIVPIETSRGCPNNCNFCTVTEFYGGKYRTKSIAHTFEGLRRLEGIGESVFFVDDNFVGNPSHSIGLLERMADSGLNKRFGIAQVTVRSAKNYALTSAMKNAGVKMLCVGIESLNDETLNSFGKPSSAKKNEEAIKEFREKGFWTHGFLMPGGDNDTPESLRGMLEWSKKYLDSVQFSSPTPLPGSKLRSQMQEEGRILTEDWSLYDVQHVVFRPKNFTPYQLQKTIWDMYEDFYSAKNSLQRLKKSPDKKFASVLLAYTMMNLKKNINVPQAKEHLKFLKAVS